MAEQDLIEIVNSLRKDYAVMLMTEMGVNLGEDANSVVAQPKIPNIRIWAAIIELSDHFVGCDSVGQHIARALEKTATVIIGSTFPINVSYPNYNNFDIIDLGEKTRKYSPIRISMEDHIERNNDQCMSMDPDQLSNILKIIRRRLGKSTKSNMQTIPSTFDAKMKPIIQEMVNSTSNCMN
jgi:ADP-heptose:LPS heptosyltransferase